MASPYDIQRYNRQGIADAVTGLGEILLGTPQLDAQLAQGQAQMALRNKRMAEAQAAEQEAAQSMMNQNRASRVYHQLAATDPNAPDFQENLANNMALLMGTGAYDDPAKYGAVARLFTNIGGGDINQIARGETDLSKLTELEKMQAAQERRERAASVFANINGLGDGSVTPEDVYTLLESGGLPDFVNQSVANTVFNNTPFPRSIAVNSGAITSFQDDTGRIVERNQLVDPRVARVQGDQNVAYNPADAFRSGGAPPPVAGPPAEQPGAMAPSPAQPPASTGQSVPGPVSPEAQPSAQDASQPLSAEEVLSPNWQEHLAQRTNSQFQVQPGEDESAPEVAVLENDVGRVQIPRTEDGSYMTVAESMNYIGPGGWLQRKTTDLGGGFTDRLSFNKAKVARTSLGLLNAEVRALLSVSDRPSVMELGWINDQLAKGDFFESPSAAADVIGMLKGSLQRDQQLIRRQLAQNLPLSVRNKLMDQLVYTQGLINKIGDVEPVSSSEVFQRTTGELQEAFGLSPETAAPVEEELDPESIRREVMSLPPEYQQELRGNNGG